MHLVKVTCNSMISRLIIVHATLTYHTVTHSLDHKPFLDPLFLSTNLFPWHEDCDVALYVCCWCCSSGPQQWRQLRDHRRWECSSVLHHQPRHGHHRTEQVTSGNHRQALPGERYISLFMCHFQYPMKICHSISQCDAAFKHLLNYCVFKLYNTIFLVI